MSLQTYGWLILLFPLAGAILIALTLQAAAAARRTACIGTLAIALVVRLPRSARCSTLAGPRRGGAPGRLGRRGTTRTRSASTRSSRS